MEAEAKPRLTIGEFLKQVREKRGLTIEYVADQLKLKVSTVKALEANSYQEIGSLVYVKGYLRSYARLLHVNIEKHLQIDAQEPVVSLAAASGRSIDDSKGETKFSFWLIVLLIIVAVVIAFAMRYKHSREIDEQETTVVALPATTVNTVPAVTPSVATVSVEPALSKPEPKVEKPEATPKVPAAVTPAANDQAATAPKTELKFPVGDEAKSTAPVNKDDAKPSTQDADNENSDNNQE